MPAAAGQWADPSKMTSADLRQIANVIDQKDFDLTQAIRTAKRQCDGTIIMAQGKLVDGQQYSQNFQSKSRYDDDNQRSQSGKKVVFEIACADENTMAANHIAVCPDTGEVKLVRASTMDRQDRFGRQVSDRERVNRDYDDNDRNRTWDRDDEDTDRDRDFAWDDWDGDGRKHEISGARDYNDRDDWAWNREDDRGAVGMGLIRRASDVIGANVENTKGENLGEIEDLAVDARTGQIRYAVLSFGGFMGIGDKLFAVPWTAFTKQDEKTYVLHTDKERLANAPGFEKDKWPDMANQQWGSDIHAFYNVQPYWNRPTTDRYAQDDRYSRNQGTTQRDRYTDDAPYNQDRMARERYMDDDRHTRSGELDRDRFTQSGQGSQLQRTCVRALEQNDFELTDAIQKAESETDGQAISARCQLASATQTGSQSQDQTGTRNYNTEEDEDTDYQTQNRNTSSSSKVVIEVATFMQGDTQNLRIVTISPETGEVIRTRNQSLSSTGTRSDAAIERDRLAESD
jgi:sporulation protein YlmC with PRC-barrel domain